MTSISIRAEGLTKVYTTQAESVRALKDIDFSVDRGEFVSFMGPSGAGKTTLLNLIGGLDNPTKGNIEVMEHRLSGAREKDLHEMRRDSIGFVFQEFFLIPSLTAVENVELPAVFRRSGKPGSRERAEMLLDRVGLKDRMTHFPKELSGGEMQRVAIARALMNEPDVILADEPTGNLDTVNARRIFSLLQDIRDEGVTVVAATHNVALAKGADRIFHLSGGRILHVEEGRA